MSEKYTTRDELEWQERGLSLTESLPLEQQLAHAKATAEENFNIAMALHDQLAAANQRIRLLEEQLATHVSLTRESGAA